MNYFEKLPIKILTNILGVFLIFLIWWAFSFGLNTTLLPSPYETIKTFFSLFKNLTVWEAILGTISRLLISFIICLLVALIMGLFAGLIKPLYRLLNPLIILLRTLPTAAVIYLLIVITKPINALYIISFLLIFPILYESVVVGIKNIDPNVMDSLRLESKKFSPYSIFKVIFPLSKPYISLGIVQSLGLGMKVSIMSEVLCGDNKIKGLGRLIYFASLDSNAKQIIALSIFAVLFISLVDIILSLLKRNLKK